MKEFDMLYLIIGILILNSCSPSSEKKVVIEKENKAIEISKDLSPNEMLNKAYQLFKEGNDKASIELANKVLSIGKLTKNDTLVGKALTSLCRNSQRSLDTIRLAELSQELKKLAEKNGNKQWLMYRAHMNAEMWRLIGDMNKAEKFYNESLEISFTIGAMGMYTIDHFNKSFMCIEKGNFEAAKLLINKYYRLREDNGFKKEDPYGLIALAYLLEQQKNYEGAFEVTTTSRRLFKEQNIFPEPPDEKPLLKVEDKLSKVLDKTIRDEISKKASSASVTSLIRKYL
tara:strand:+ start:1693 stop:2550 length:858 start_codon:yes stop_codon:yes gene_type:complete